MFYAIVVSLAVAVVASVLAKVGRIALFPKAPNIPRAYGNERKWMPFGLGAAAEFNKDPLRFLQSQRRRLGNTFRLNFGFFEWVFVFGLDAQTSFLKAANDLLNFQEGVDDMIGDAVHVPVEKEWNKMTNSLITKGFMKQERVQLHAKLASEEVDAAIKRWMEAGPIDLFREVSSTVLHVAMRSMLGDRVHDKHGGKLIPLYQHFEEDMVNPLTKIFPSWVPLPARNRTERMYQYMDSIVSEEVKLRLEEMKQGKEMPNDYLQILIKETGDRYAHLFGSHLMLVIMAAHTNTAGTSAWTLGQLYSNPEFLERVRKEVVSTAGDARTLAARQALAAAQPTFLNACMQETGRLYSGALLLRKSKQVFEADGVTVPPGCIVVTYPSVTHSDVHVDADKYIPERWIPGTAAYTAENDMRPSSKVIAHAQFGGGRHPCLGERFAIAVMTILWAAVTAELKLEFVDAAGNRIPVSAKNFAERYPPAWLSTLGTPWPSNQVFVKAVKREGL